MRRRKISRWRVHKLGEKGRGGGGGGGGRRDHNYNAIFCSNAAEFYSWPRQLFLSSEHGVGKGEGGGGGGEGGRGGERGGGDLNCNTVFRSNAAELYLSAKAIVSFQ